MSAAPLFTDYYSNVLANDQINASAISPDGTMVAIAHQNGEIFILSTERKLVLFKWQVFNEEQTVALPVYSLSWCPNPSIDHQYWKLIGACRDGGIIEWTPSMGDKYEHKYLTEDNKYETIAYNASGNLFVTAGSLPKIEIFDSISNKIVQTYDGMHNFHNKPIQTTGWYPGSDSKFYSGGWDSSVKFWDLTSPKGAICKIYGVQVAGDSVDMHRDCQTVAIGGSSAEEGIMIYDLRNPGAPVRLIPYDFDQDSGEPYNTKVNSIKFLHGSDLFLAGVDDETCPLKCFNFVTGEEVHAFKHFVKSCTSIDILPFSKQISIGDSVGNFQIINYSTDTFTQSDEEVEEVSPFYIRRNRAQEIIEKHAKKKSLGLDYEWPASNDFSRYSTIKTRETVTLKTEIPITLKSSLEHQEFDPTTQEDPLTKELISKQTDSYNVATEPIHQEIQSMRSSAKRRLQHEVEEREERVMAEFMKKAELIKIINENESGNDQSKIWQLDETDRFIKEIEDHLKTSKQLTSKKEGRPIPKLLDIDHLTQELYKNQTPLNRLPVIKGEIKNVKRLLQEDLLADGAISLRVPHQQRSRNSLSKDASLKSQPTFGYKKTSAAQAEAHYILKYQKNMIVEMPVIDDKVAQNFEQFWKNPPTFNKYTVQVPENKDSSIQLNQQLQGNLKNKRPSYLPKLDHVPHSARQRIPDSDHLAKMRVYLINAHDNFEKETNDVGLLPSALKARNEKRKETETELGESLMELMIKGRASLNKNAVIQQLLDNGVDDNISEDDDQYQELEYTGMQSPHHTHIVTETSDNSYKPHPQLEAFEAAVKSGNLQLALEMAASSQQLINESMRLQKYNQRSDSYEMRHNQFFRKFTAQYSRQLKSILEKNFGQRLNDRLKIKDKDAETFNQKIMSHVQDQSVYRKKHPEVFQNKYDASDDIQQLMKNNFKQVSVPASIKKQREAEQNMMRDNGRSLVKVNDPLGDAQYVRRLKMANYGRWFLNPDKFTQKVKMLNNEMDHK